MLTDIEVGRFSSKIERRTEQDCWPWKAYKTRFGYGVFSVRRGKKTHNILAHRLRYFLEHGAFDENLCICHQCDNPSCCNPDHLFLGTQAENLTDMWQKGRARPGRSAGEKNGSSKIDAEPALAIRDASGKVRDIARKFGIGKSQVSNIRRGVTGWF